MPTSRYVYRLLSLLLALSFTGCGPKEYPKPGISDKPAQRVAEPAGIFEEVGERAGLAFRHTNGVKERFYYIETLGGGCAFLDFDGDGLQDILLQSCGDIEARGPDGQRNLALYRNKGDGTFEDVTTAVGLDKPLGYMQAVAVGDYDNDGFPDIYVAGYGSCHLFHNEGSGAPGGGSRRFVEVTDRAGVGDTDKGEHWGSGAAFGDYDNDGKLDLVLIRYAVWSPQTDKKCLREDGSPTYCVPSVYAGDFIRLFHNEGGGKFKDVTAQAGLATIGGRGLAVAWLDYDGDGKIDLCIANDVQPDRLFHNNGNGTFTDKAVTAGVAYGADGAPTSSMGIAAGDYDHSGRQSLFITDLHGEGYSLFRNAGPGMFNYESDQAGIKMATVARTGWGAAFFDYDHDGWLDLVTANGNVHKYLAEDRPGIGYEQPNSLFHNLHNGRFEDATSQSGGMTIPWVARGLAVGDYDNDSRPDVLCINRDERATLFHNVNKESNGFIGINLVGTKSNRDGAGAKVWVTAGGIRQFAESRLSSSYASSSDKRLLFGLGAATKIDKIEILWPSGQRDSYNNATPGGYFTATEGKGLTPIKSTGGKS